MRSLYEHLPPVEIAGRKFVGRVLFALLVLVSVLIGATVGLLLVYTTDLPQVDALEDEEDETHTNRETLDPSDRPTGPRWFHFAHGVRE